jgi:glycosyltransferase involved in cell wall biosynthesis
LTFAISPITQAYPALLHKKLYKSRAFLWLQDLWPESVSTAGKMNNRFVLSLLDKMVSNIYKKADKILVQSKTFIVSIKEKGIQENKIAYIPNWAEDLFLNGSIIDKDRYRNVIPHGFIIMFAGNIGEAQDFESILKAAETTKDIAGIQWVIIGDGRKKGWVENEIVRLGLQGSVKLMGRYPVEEMPDFFVHADIMLLTLKDEKNFSMTIPSKLQSYMAFGKPIMGMLNGIGRKLILEADCGYTCSAGNCDAFSKNILAALKEDRKILSEKGQNGKRYYEKNFAKDIIIENIINIFQE